MNRIIFKIGGRALLLAAILFGVVGTANAQVTSNTATVALNMTVSESITVSATPASITFTPAANDLSATASGPISITTSWNIAGGHTSITGYAGINGTTALSNGAASVPVADLFGAINGGTALPFNTSNQGVAPASLVPGPLFVVSSPVAGFATRTDSIVLSISGMGQPFTPGSYTGTLYIVAQVI